MAKAEVRSRHAVKCDSHAVMSQGASPPPLATHTVSWPGGSMGHGTRKIRAAYSIHSYILSLRTTVVLPYISTRLSFLLWRGVERPRIAW